MKNEFNLHTFKYIINKGYKYFIFDCDGVIWYDNKLIPEAIESIQYLIKDNRKVFFLSNNNRISREKIYCKIISTGIKDIDISAVYPSSYLTAKYISQNYSMIKKIYLIGSLDLQHELEKVGLEVHGGQIDNDKRVTVDQITKLKIDSYLDAAVCGSDDFISYYKISYAANVAYRTKLLFGTNYDNNWKNGDLIIPGAYTYISSIETASEIKAKIVAKPNKEVLSTIFVDHSLNESEAKDKTLMIGDSLRTDIRFANNCGIDSCLVLTGHINENEFKESIFNNENPRPSYIVQNLNLC